MFELTINKQDLLNPLLTVIGAVDKKQAFVILSNILVTVKQEELVLTATDLEIEMTSHAPCVSADAADHQSTVPAKKMVDIIRSLDDEPPLKLRFDAQHVVIKQGRSQFKIATMPADDYPCIQGDLSQLNLTVPRMVLMHLLQSTAFAMAQQDVRVYLNGLFIELDGQSITTVTMDGHRMAVCKWTCDTKHSPHRLLLPKKGVQEMMRLLQSVPDESVILLAGVNHIKLVTQQHTFFSKLIESPFPPYSRAIPRTQDKHVIIDRELLKRALSRIIILAHEKSHAVLLSIQDQQLTLIANNQEQEEALESLAAQTQGDALQIGVNAHYLLDVLNYIHDGLLRLSFTDRDSSILVESLEDEQYQYVIMPMKI